MTVRSEIRFYVYLATISISRSGVATMRLSHVTGAVWKKIAFKNNIQVSFKWSITVHWTLDMVRGFRLPPLCWWELHSFESSSNLLLTFRDNVSFPSSRINKSKKKISSWPLKMGQIRCPETSVSDYHSTLRNIPKEHKSQLDMVTKTSMKMATWVAETCRRYY